MTSEAAKEQRVGWWPLLGQGLANRQPCPHCCVAEDALIPLGKGLSLPPQLLEPFLHWVTVLHWCPLGFPMSLCR